MEKIFKSVSFLSASLILVISIGIFGALLNSSREAMSQFGFGFLTSSAWNKNIVIKNKQTNTNNNSDNVSQDTILEQSSNTKKIFAGLAPLFGSLASTFLAIIFALPLALGIAVFLAELAPKFLSTSIGLGIELLAAIPSIIFGMWGLFYFAPLVEKFVGGYQVSLLNASLVLAIMILPFIASLSKDSIKNTPDILKESAYGLGATKFEVIKDIIFPFCKKGIVGSIILALGRALGETMAVAFLLGSVFKIPSSLTSPTISIPVALANNFAEATGLEQSSLFYLAFLLFIISFFIIFLAKFFFLKKAKA